MFHTRLEHTAMVLLVALNSLFSCLCCFGQTSSSAGTTTFVFDGNRMYAELGFVRQDGSIHRALTFVDMGSPSMVLTESLFKELHLDQNKTLLFRVGQLAVEVAPTDVVSERMEPYSIGSDLRVEGVLPASILERYQVVIDYQRRTLALAQGRVVKPEGISIPFHINRKTGLIAVDASIDGKSYAITIDNGSAYTWVRQSTAKSWLVSHPGWERGVGAVGVSNMMMSGDGSEASGTLLRIPEVSLGKLALNNVGVFAAGPGKPFPGNLDLFDWYSQKNDVPVIGWIGGNILKQFHLTIDYPNQVMFWLRQTDPDSHDLDQVGLTLLSEHGEFAVAAIAKKNGRPTVEGVSRGDRLIRIDDLETKNATWGAIYNAMHGKPGETRTLVLERNGTRFTVAATVTAF